MTIAPALSDDLAAGSAITSLADAKTAVELLIGLETSGAMTATTLQLPDVDWDTYQSVGHFLGSINRRCSWHIGDWLLHGKAQFGDEFVQAAAITGLAEQTLLGRMFVCENVPPARRHANVSFSCHSAVARLTPQAQSRWLKACAKGGWSYAELKARMKAARKDERPQIPGVEDPEDREIDTNLLIEVAQAILRDAAEDDDPGFYRVPVEDIARLKGALGIE